MLSGLALAVEWPRHPYPGPGTVYYYYFHLTPQTIPASHSWIPGGTAYSDAVQYGHATPSRVVKPFAVLIDGYQRVFYTYGPLAGALAVAVPGSLAGAHVTSGSAGGGAIEAEAAGGEPGREPWPVRDIDLGEWRHGG